jgi:hypothetical protein
VDGEVIEVENPDDPHGLPFYKFKTFEAKEETKHKKKIEWMMMVLTSPSMMWTWAWGSRTLAMP